jgi:hypothetical protein
MVKGEALLFLAGHFFYMYVYLYRTTENHYEHEI